MLDENRSIVVFSGGSAANNLVDVFETVRESKNCPLSYIIPISDNGGSSSEIVRVFGGPGIGDVRSRLVRLIPSHPPSAEREAISQLFNRRLSDASPTVAAAEWQDIVAGTSDHWRGIPSAKKELIRSFFNYVNLEILKRSRPPTSTFDFTSASVGNLFLTGARLFSGSFESAIYLLSSLCQIPDGQVRVIPNINSNFQHHIAAGLANGDIIVGQNNISHPSAATSIHVPADASATVDGTVMTAAVHPQYSSLSLDGSDSQVEDSYMPGTLATLRQRNIRFSKDEDEDLPARIERIWYINPFGQEMLLSANPRAISAVKHAQAIIFSIGSLYTSIIPSIVLGGVGEAIRQSKARDKILILNGSLDREVGPSSAPFTAFDFVEAVARAAEQSRGMPWPPVLRTPDPDSDSPSDSSDSDPRYGESQTVYREYVTHVIHLSGKGTPAVDQKRLAAVGIDCLKLYGRKDAGGKGMSYDGQALVGAIQAILGKKGEAMSSSRNRRNTLAM